MQHKPITPLQTFKRAVIYALMTAAVVTSAFVLVMFTMGYRFDREDRSVERIGLVQFGSQPSGARVHIDGVNFNKTTSTKTTLPEGSYTVEMRREGYTTWRKTVPVQAGSVVWLTYPRLIPQKLEPKNVLSLEKPLSSLASPSRKYIALTHPGPSIDIHDISSSQPTKVTIKADVKSAESSPKANYRLVSWSADSGKLVARDSAKKPSQWLVVDRRDKEVFNLNQNLGIKPDDVQFHPGNSRYLYALSGGDLRKIDLKNQNLSRVLLTNVKSFSLHESTITYATNPDPKTKKSAVGLLHEGSELPIVIESKASHKNYYDITMSTFYGDNFVAIIQGKNLRLYKGKLNGLEKEGDFEEAYRLIYQTSLDVAPVKIEFANNGRFLVAEQPGSYSVYDLEMQRLTVASQGGLSGWLDGYLNYSDDGKNLTISEFDGENTRQITENFIAGQAVTFNPKKDYIYWFNQGEKGQAVLNRVAIRL